MALCKEKTLEREIVFQGKTLFSDQEVTVRLIPAPCGTGIVFKRVDLNPPLMIPAKTEQVQNAIRTTQITQGAHSVQTIEHFMAAIHAKEIDNLFVEITGAEMPIFDGSALPFLQLLDQAGSVEQDQERAVYGIEEPIYWSDGEMHLVALPADELRISYTLHYPQSPYLQSQYYSYVVRPETFEKEIAPCRTFTLYQDIAPLIEKGILKNAKLDHGVVIDEDRVLNPEGVRFSNEMVRHKILDMIGDFALLGHPFHAHLIAIKTGHAANHMAARILRKFLRKK